jgi:hypothetical protein
VRAARPRGATGSPARSDEIDAKHAQLLSAFVAATQAGDLNRLTQLLASDVRVVTDGGGKMPAALNVIDGADRVAQFLVSVTRKGWREEFRLRFATINGLSAPDRVEALLKDAGPDSLWRSEFRIDEPSEHCSPVDLGSDPPFSSLGLTPMCTQLLGRSGSGVR